MKQRLLLCLGLVLLALQGFATGQEADVIYVDGVRYELLARPIAQNEVLFQQLRQLTVAERGWITSNWEGIRGYWSIANERLRLDSVGYLSKKGDAYVVFDRHRFKRVFKAYRKHGHVVATWVSGTLRYGRGNLVRYVHDGFDRNYTHETVAEVVNGNVTKQKTFHNEKLAGVSFTDICNPDSIEKYIPLADIPELEGRGVMLNVQLFPSHWGQMANSCKVEIMRMQPDSLSLSAQKRLKEIVASSLLSVYPWEQYCINGERKMAVSSFCFKLDGTRKTRGRIYELCDTMPEFPGGQQAMFKFIAEHLQWPTIAREWTGNWRVVIKFIVEADGTLSYPQFVYRTDIPFEIEALKVWRQFPRFKPAIKGGWPVRCRVVFPIRFKGL